LEKKCSEFSSWVGKSLIPHIQSGQEGGKKGEKKETVFRSGMIRGKNIRLGSAPHIQTYCCNCVVSCSLILFRMNWIERMRIVFYLSPQSIQFFSQSTTFSRISSVESPPLPKRDSPKGTHADNRVCSKQHAGQSTRRNAKDDRCSKCIDEA
jgi:hypothetical protein